MDSLSSIHLGTPNNRILLNFHTNTPFLYRARCTEKPSKSISTRPKLFLSSNSQSAERYSLSHLDPLEAVLFDIDGTLCDSDPIHFYAFQEMLQELGYNDGIPIDEEFFIQKIAGKHNEELSGVLLPDWALERALKFMDDKEAMFRRLAPGRLKPVNGVHKLCKWIEDRGLKRGAVTNAPRSNAELLLSIIGLSDYFQTVVVASDCPRPKPFPDLYFKGLELIKASSCNTLVFEDSVSGVKAAVAAGLPVVAVTIRNPEELLKEAGATLLIKDFDDPNLWRELEALRIVASEPTIVS